MTTPRKQSDLLSDVGRMATDQTLADLEASERRRPGAVGRVIVYFDGFIRDEPDYLRQYGTLADHRAAIESAAEDLRAQTQEATREFLLHNSKARDAFAGTGFAFEPAIHVESLATPNVIFTPANLALAKEIARLPEVVAICNDQPMATMSWGGGQFLPEPMGDHKDGYTWGWNFLGIPEIHHNEKLRGDDVVIGMVDSGICSGHPDLNGKIAEFSTFDPITRKFESAVHVDPTGHGTRIGGILVGGKNSGCQIGGAPNSRLAVVSVDTRSGEARLFSRYIKAVEHLTRSNRDYEVKLVNVSLGVEPQNVRKSDLDLHAYSIEQILRRKVLIIAAIGNYPKKRLIPAQLPGILSAGAHHPNCRRWAENGKKPSLFLPGTSTFSSWPVKGPGASVTKDLHHFYEGCSSAATAHLTAIAALITQKFKQIGPEDVADALRRTASWRRFPSLKRALVHLEAKYGKPSP